MEKTEVNGNRTEEFRLSGNQRIGYMIMMNRKLKINKSRRAAAPALNTYENKLQEIENGSCQLSPEELLSFKQKLGMGNDVLAIYCHETCAIGRQKHCSSECGNRIMDFPESIAVLEELCEKVEDATLEIITKIDLDHGIPTRSEIEAIDKSLNIIDSLRFKLQGLQLSASISTRGRLKIIRDNDGKDSLNNQNKKTAACGAV